MADETSKTPRLLAGGNPQIAKGEGDASVQAYIAAMPGWKSDVGRRLDALIERTVPDVQKAVKWNSPMYGMKGQGWFLGVHCYTRYIKLAFFRGASLDPVPPVDSKDSRTRYVHLHEGEPLDEPLLASWIKQASTLPGWVPSGPTTQSKATATLAREGGPETGQAEASQLIDARIKALNDWRGETLAKIRSLIREADPEVVEEWKWRGVPVWSHAGIICTGETYKEVVKMTFAKGAALEDPSGLFNSSLEGNTRRAIDIRQGDRIDEEALKALIRAAVALNLSSKKR